MIHVPEADPYFRRRSLPRGAERLFVRMRDGWPVRMLHWPHRETAGEPVRSHLLMVTGRADFAEKYAETLHDLVDAGRGVTIFDWRGQGLSRRVGKTPMHGASPTGAGPGFDVWLDDLQEIADWAAARAQGPVHAVAHSMGGHLVLRHLAAGRSGIARAAVLAPMTGLAARPLGPTIARFMAARMVKRGNGSDYVLGGGPWEPGAPGSQRQKLLTSDIELFRDESWWIGQYPSLALGSVTWGWLADAFASIDALGAAGVPEAIAAPVLALIPQKDGLVDSDSTRRLFRRIPGAQLDAYNPAGHELLRESEPLRSTVLERVLSFLGGNP